MSLRVFELTCCTQFGVSSCHHASRLEISTTLAGGFVYNRLKIKAMLFLAWCTVIPQARNSIACDHTGKETITIKAKYDTEPDEDVAHRVDKNYRLINRSATTILSLP